MIELGGQRCSAGRAREAARMPPQSHGLQVRPALPALEADLPKQPSVIGHAIGISIFFTKNTVRKLIPAVCAFKTACRVPCFSSGDDAITYDSDFTTSTNISVILFEAANAPKGTLLVEILMTKLSATTRATKAILMKNIASSTNSFGSINETFAKSAAVLIVCAITTEIL